MAEFIYSMVRARKSVGDKLILDDVTMSFFPGPQVWLVKDSESSVVLSVMFFVIHMLRMLTFFLIAGFVARMSFERLGAGSFFKDRLRRIGIVALARKLLIALWHYLKSGTPPEGAVFRGPPKKARAAQTSAC